MAKDLDTDLPTTAKSGKSTVGTFDPAYENPDTATRRVISYLLLALLTSIIVAAFIALFLINDVDTAADAVADSDRLVTMLNIIFGPVVTLVSSVVGFYFGARTAQGGN